MECNVFPRVYAFLGMGTGEKEVALALYYNNSKKYHNFAIYCSK